MPSVVFSSCTLWLKRNRIVKAIGHMNPVPSVVKLPFAVTPLALTDFKNTKPAIPDRIEAVRIANFVSENVQRIAKRAQGYKN